MQFKIDEEGILYIKRGSKWQKQQCPYTSLPDEDLMACAHWCPLFGEPELDHDYECHKDEATGQFVDSDTLTGKTCLSLCRCILVGTCIDERPRGAEGETQ